VLHSLCVLRSLCVLYFFTVLLYCTSVLYFCTHRRRFAEEESRRKKQEFEDSVRLQVQREQDQQLDSQRKARERQVVDETEAR
jgi:hypothetical protein